MHCQHHEAVRQRVNSHTQSERARHPGRYHLYEDPLVHVPSQRRAAQPPADHPPGTLKIKQALGSYPNLVRVGTTTQSPLLYKDRRRRKLRTVNSAHDGVLVYHPPRPTSRQWQAKTDSRGVDGGRLRMTRTATLAALPAEGRREREYQSRPRRRAPFAAHRQRQVFGRIYRVHGAQERTADNLLHSYTSICAGAIVAAQRVVARLPRSPFPSRMWPRSLSSPTDPSRTRSSSRRPTAKNDR